MGGINSDHFFSAPLSIYAPLWYICQEWGWRYKLSDHFYSAPSRNYAHYGIIVMIVVGALSYLTTSILPFAKLCPIMVYLS